MVKFSVYLNRLVYVMKRTSGPVAHLRLFGLSKLMLTFLNNETYGYSRQYNLKTPLVSLSDSNWY